MLPSVLATANKASYEHLLGDARAAGPGCPVGPLLTEAHTVLLPAPLSSWSGDRQAKGLRERPQPSLNIASRCVHEVQVFEDPTTPQKKHFVILLVAKKD